MACSDGKDHKWRKTKGDGTPSGRWYCFKCPKTRRARPSKPRKGGY